MNVAITGMRRNYNKNYNCILLFLLLLLFNFSFQLSLVFCHQFNQKLNFTLSLVFIQLSTFFFASCLQTKTFSKLVSKFAFRTLDSMLDAFFLGLKEDAPSVVFHLFVISHFSFTIASFLACVRPFAVSFRIFIFFHLFVMF